MDSTAVPFPPTVHLLEQADGSTFEARMWGDEWAHGWQTIYGFTIVFDEASGNWYYAQKNPQGELEPTSVRVQPGETAPTYKNGKEIPRSVTPDTLEDTLSRAVPPVYPITQADGTVIHAKRWAENGYVGWETTYGYTIFFDGEGGNWVYALRREDGRLDRSTIIAREGSHIPAYEDGARIPKHLRPSDPAKHPNPNLRSLIAQMALPEAKPPIDNVPVILARWGDHSDDGSPVEVVEPSYSKEDFERVLFGVGSDSMADYYREASGQTLSVKGKVSDWVRLNYGFNYYGFDHVGETFKYEDYHRLQFIDEAVRKADPQIDFSQFDSDKDCYVDFTMLVHQGDSTNTSNNPFHMLTYNWDMGGAVFWGFPGNRHVETADACPTDLSRQMLVDKFSIQPEWVSAKGALTGAGLFAHEFGHLLELPELYDQHGGQGVGFWDLMGVGCWLGGRPGSESELHAVIPALPSAWSRMRLGWAEPLSAEGDQSGVSIPPVSDGGPVYRYGSGVPTDTTGEYFLIENRQPLGFDRALPDAGLAVWHIDQGKISYLNSQTCVPSATDCSDNHYLVSLIQADGKWDLERNIDSGDEGDLFGPGPRSEISDTTNPGSLFYNGAPSGLRINNIRAQGNTLVVDFGQPGCSGDVLEFAGKSYPSGTATHCTASVSITAGEFGGVPTRVQAGAEVSYTAPLIRLVNGFVVEPGGRMSARTAD